MFHRAPYRLWVGALHSLLDISDNPEKLRSPNMGWGLVLLYMRSWCWVEIGTIEGNANLNKFY